jgi:hypothetical protein
MHGLRLWCCSKASLIMNDIVFMFVERDIDGMLASTSSESVVSCIKTQSLGNGGTESYLANQKVSPWKQFVTF